MPDQNREIGGRYTLEEVLGRGGAGTVWRGRDAVLQRAVAIKEIVLPAGLPDADQHTVRRRVFREARAAGRLTHRSVTTVFDIVEADGHGFIVMELVHAPTLAQLVRDSGPLEASRVAAIGLQMLSALEAAHREGIVHRDVKPSNVMVGDDGAVKLSDFGIASLHDDPAITASGALMGSPAYMAPEQARGSATSPATDLWGLGATLYFAVEGAGPFDRGAAIPTLAAVLHDQPATPRGAGPLAGTILALLAKDPERRPTPAALRADLEAADGLAVRTPTVSTAPPRGAAPASGAAPPPAIVPPAASAASPPSGVAPAESAAASAGEPPPRTAAVAARPGVAGPTDADRSARRRSLAVLVGVGALLVAAAGLALASLGDLGQDAPTQATEVAAQPDPPASAAPPTPQPTAAATPQAPTTQATTQPTAEQTVGPTADETTATESDGAAVGPDAAPAGWTTYTDDAVGYSLAYPDGWEVVPVSDTITDFRDPDTGTYLRVDWTDDPRPDPVADWQAQSERFGASHTGYEEVRIDPVAYRGHDAALWEYRYTEGGAQLHAYNLGLTTGEFGHALNFQTREENWAESQDLFETFTQVFLPAG